MTYRIRPDINGQSPLAIAKVLTPNDVIDRSAPVHSVVIHTTGSGIVTKALKAKADAFAYTLDYYDRAEYFAHYLVGYQGEVGQVADEHERAPHVGWPQEARQAFLGGTWGDTIPRSLETLWRTRWPSYASPAHLFPGPSPNNIAVGVEVLPWQPGCPGFAMGEGKHTRAQYQALAALAQDIARRWEFPDGWQRTGRLCTHEDLNPLEWESRFSGRSTHGQGWDPGCLRTANPFFDWAFFLSLIEGPLVG